MPVGVLWLESILKIPSTLRSLGLDLAYGDSMVCGLARGKRAYVAEKTTLSSP